MIDFHAHILPRIDDGSQSVEESIAMLESMKAQGIKKVIATPHFLANHESVSSFVERRNASLERLRETMPDLPEIAPGAEVKYYDGISHLPDLKKLRIENSKLLLLEMPFSAWSEYTVKEVADIAGRGKITLVLAHIERYLPMQNSAVLYRLLEHGVLFQSNASFFLSRFTRHKALRMLKNHQIHFLGSDAHNMTDRAPNTAKAVAIIQKKCGEAFADDFITYGNELFLQHTLT